jgi:hypothetical protein
MGCVTRSPGACRPATSCVGPPCSPRRASFHKAKVPALSHSIDGVDKLVSFENGYQPVHCQRGVSQAWRVVFSEDAPGILESLQYSLLIRVVHGTRLTERRLN